SKGKPHSYVTKLPKWEAQLGSYEEKLKETKAQIEKASSKFKNAAAAYGSVPITTVRYETKAQESLEDVLNFILDVKDLEKQKTLLTKYQASLKNMEDKQATSAEGLLETIWSGIVDFWQNLLHWAKGLIGAVYKFSNLVHIEESMDESATA